ncbi:flagellar export protein FliJ [Halocella sp. SP3-1]|nr:flagellar export protein FliJ [Halocella sp. SP3-1]
MIMKGFQFNLNRVLDVRKLEEQLSRNRLLGEKHKAAQIEGKLEELNHKQHKIYNYLREKDNEITVEEMLQTRNFIHRQRRQIKQVSGKLSEQMAEVDKCNTEFIEKKKKKEILEKLKEKEYQQYRQELFRKEQQLIDEINQQLKKGRWFE